MNDQADLMSEASQRRHITDCFRVLFNDGQLPVNVEWTTDEGIVVTLGADHDHQVLVNGTWFIMEIGSDDDRYRFELWYAGRDTGIYIEFAFPGETL